MPKFFVKHGTIKIDSEKFIKAGQSLELSADEAKEIDPEGDRLVTAEAWEELKKADAATKRAAELQKNPTKATAPAK